MQRYPKMCRPYQYHTQQARSRNRWPRGPHTATFALIHLRILSAAASPVLRASQPAARELGVVKEVVDLLKKYPQIKFERRGEDSVLVPPTSAEGFPVLIEQIWEGHYAVSFGGWQKDFSSLEEAVACFVMGLSNHCRLKVESKGKKPVRWTVEQLENAGWKEVSSRGSWAPLSFKEPVTSYLMNDLLSEIRDRAQEEVPAEPTSLVS